MGEEMCPKREGGSSTDTLQDYFRKVEEPDLGKE